MTNAKAPNDQLKAAAVFFLAMICFGGVAFLGVSESLHHMTENDCKAGIQAACDQLAK